MRVQIVDRTNSCLCGKIVADVEGRTRLSVSPSYVQVACSLQDGRERTKEAGALGKRLDAMAHSQRGSSTSTDRVRYTLLP